MRLRLRSMPGRTRDPEAPVRIVLNIDVALSALLLVKRCCVCAVLREIASLCSHYSGGGTFRLTPATAAVGEMVEESGEARVLTRDE
jgi:hypothetical protein